MRTMIAIPCLDMVHTLFFASFSAMRKPEGTELAIASCSLVYESRHTLAQKAVDDSFDRVLWLDSDMTFEPDLLERFAADLDQGMEYVSGLCFTRKEPVKPCAYEVCRPVPGRDGKMIPTAESFKDIPDGLFEIEGSGLAAVMMTTDLIRRVGPLPFYPLDGFGEDLTFCRKAREAGAKLWCDSRIQLGHIGTTVFNKDTWIKLKGAKA